MKHPIFTFFFFFLFSQNLFSQCDTTFSYSLEPDCTATFIANETADGTTYIWSIDGEELTGQVVTYQFSGGSEQWHSIYLSVYNDSLNCPYNLSSIGLRMDCNAGCEYPDASFTYSLLSDTCYTYLFEANTIDEVNNYQWDFHGPVSVNYGSSVLYQFLNQWNQRAELTVTPPDSACAVSVSESMGGEECVECNLSGEFTYEVLDDCMVAFHASDLGAGIVYTWTINGVDYPLSSPDTTVTFNNPTPHVWLQVADSQGCQGGMGAGLFLQNCIYQDCGFDSTFNYTIENCLVSFWANQSDPDSLYTYFWYFDDEFDHSAHPTHPAHFFTGDNPHSATLIIVDNETNCLSSSTQNFDLIDCDSIDCSYLDPTFSYEVGDDDCSAVFSLDNQDMEVYLNHWFFDGTPTYTVELQPTVSFQWEFSEATVYLTDTTTGCSVEHTEIITSPNCICNIDTTLSYGVVSPGCMVFFETQIENGAELDSVLWHFDDGYNLWTGGSSVLYTFARGQVEHVVTVEIFLSNGCYASSTHIINVPDCIDCDYLDGEITFEVLDSCVVNFSLTNPDMETYLNYWSFSNGVPFYSTEINPTVSFNGGVNTVLVSLDDSITGCFAMDTVDIFLPGCNCNLDVDFTYALQDDCVVVISAVDVDSTNQYHWELNGEEYVGATIYYSVQGSGIQDIAVILEVTNASTGCYGFVNSGFVVDCGDCNNPLDATFSYEVIDGCYFHFEANTIDTTLSYLWGCNSCTGTGPSIDCAFTDGITHDMTLSVFEDNGCNSTSTQTFDLMNCDSVDCSYLNPDMTFDVIDSCSIVFSLVDSNMEAYLSQLNIWGGVAGNILYSGSDLHPVVHYAGDLLFGSVNLVDDGTGCDIWEFFEVEVPNCECDWDVTFTYSLLDDCSAVFSVEDSLNQIDSLVWNFDGEIVLATDIATQHTFPGGGFYEVTLVGRTVTGCYSSHTEYVFIPECNNDCDFLDPSFSMSEAVDSCTASFSLDNPAMEEYLVGWGFTGNPIVSTETEPEVEFCEEVGLAVVVLFDQESLCVAADTMALQFPDCSCDGDSITICTDNASFSYDFASNCEMNCHANVGEDVTEFWWQVDGEIVGNSNEDLQYTFSEQSPHLVTLVTFGSSEDPNCMARSTKLVSSVGCITTIDDVESNKISFYPVPAENRLNISATRVINRFEVLDVTGKMVKTGSINDSDYQLDVSDLQTGMYFFVAYDEMGVTTFKFLKD